MDDYIFCTLFFIVLAAYANAQCPYGYWGENCSIACPYNCYSSSEGYDNKCDGANGRCWRCMPGYWGDYCGIPCSTNCRTVCAESFSNTYGSNPNKEFACGGYCDPNDGACFDCEDDQYFSQFCNVSCRELNPYCKTCPQDGSACDICDAGVPEEYCRTPCPSNCAYCNRERMECYRCSDGYWGTDCLEICNKNCIYCDKFDGLCQRCRDGYWGENCSFTCTHEHKNCLRCNKIHGICEECIDGLWGPDCQNLCNANCAEVRCEKNTGLCMVCKPLYWGAICNRSCITGDCEYVSSCTQMEGPVCFSCRTGKWGVQCSLNCSNHCLNGCKIDSGECYTIEPTATNTSLYGEATTLWPISTLFGETQCPTSCAYGCNMGTGECLESRSKQTMSSVPPTSETSRVSQSTTRTDISGKASVIPTSSEETLSLSNMIVIVVCVGSSLLISLVVAVLPYLLKYLKQRSPKKNVVGNDTKLRKNVTFTDETNVSQNDNCHELRSEQRNPLERRLECKGVPSVKNMIKLKNNTKIVSLQKGKYKYAKVKIE